MLSYLIVLQLNFTFVASEVYFWLFLALIIIISIPERFMPAPDGHLSATGLHSAGFMTVEVQPGASAQPGKNVPGWITAVKFFIIIIAGGGVMFLVNQQVGVLTADYYLRELQLARNYNQYFAALDLYDFIKQSVPKYGIYDRQFANILAGWLENFSNQGFRKYGEDKLKQILISDQGKGLDDIYTRAVINGELSATDKSRLPLAEADYLQLIAISPEMPLSYSQLANLYFKRGELDNAIKYYNLELEKIPDLKTPNFPYQHEMTAQGEVINIDLNLGDIYAQKKEKNEAEKYYKLALALDDKYPVIYKHLADYYQSNSDFEQAIWYNKKGMELEPENYEWPQKLGEIYDKMGNKIDANNYFNKAKKLAPENMTANL